MNSVHTQTAPALKVSWPTLLPCHPVLCTWCDFIWLIPCNTHYRKRMFHLIPGFFLYLPLVVYRGKHIERSRRLKYLHHPWTEENVPGFQKQINLVTHWVTTTGRWRQQASEFPKYLFQWKMRSFRKIWGLHLSILLTVSSPAPYSPET